MMRNPGQTRDTSKNLAAAARGRYIRTDMAKRAQQQAPKSFEEALQELESILNEIENGQVGLEESLVKYERGNFLIQHCRSVLSAAEKQIESLSKDGSENHDEQEPMTNQ
jgi:exodeoxyribonuclease VII small subunit